MTLINVIRQSSAVHMLADGLSFSPSGKIRRGTKLCALPHLPAMLGVRGPLLASPLLAEILGSAAGTYDELKSNVAIIVRAHMPQIVRMLEGNADPGAFEIIVGGISQSTGPDNFTMRTNGASAWIIQDPGELMISPLTDAIGAAIMSAFSGRGSYDALDPVTDGVRMIEIQRENWSFGDSTLPGGFIQLMSVGRDGLITTSIAHRWDDAETPPATELGAVA